MPRVPQSVQGLMNFCTDHEDTWFAAAEQIGLSEETVTAFKALNTATRAAVGEQQISRERSKSATLTANAQVSALRKSAGTLVRTIVAFAEAQADPIAVFAAAQIAPNATPTPSTPPGQPSDVSATLDDEGNITLRWKCVNPVGGNVVYSVMRRNDSTGTFAQVGITGSRMFTDDTIPGGSPSVQYQIRAFRGNTTGPASPIFTLQFGHGGGGGAMLGTRAIKPSTEKAPFSIAA